MCEMGKRIIRNCDGTVIFKNIRMDIETFIYIVKKMIKSGCKLSFYEALEGFTIYDSENNEFYHLKLNELEFENYKNDIYSPLIMELHNLLVFQEQTKRLVKVK